MPRADPLEPAVEALAPVAGDENQAPSRIEAGDPRVERRGAGGLGLQVATASSSASIPVLPVTWTRAGSTPSRSRLARAARGRREDAGRPGR